MDLLTGLSLAAVEAHLRPRLEASELAAYRSMLVLAALAVRTLVATAQTALLPAAEAVVQCRAEHPAQVRRAA